MYSWPSTCHASVATPSPAPPPDGAVSGCGGLPSIGTSQSRSWVACPETAAQSARTVPASHQLSGVHEGGEPLSGTRSLLTWPPALLTTCISSPVTPQTARSPEGELTAPQ